MVWDSLSPILVILLFEHHSNSLFLLFESYEIARVGLKSLTRCSSLQILNSKKFLESFSFFLALVTVQPLSLIILLLFPS